MCRVCIEALEAWSWGNPEMAFDLIKAAVKRGIPQEHFTDTIDKICGTEMEDRDEVAEEAWEKKYRGED